MGLRIHPLIFTLNFFLLLAIFPTRSFAVEKPYIISGFDDVLRQAENTGLLKAAMKIVEEDKTFSGMPELYTVISEDNSEPQFVLVSAISSWFDSRIGNFLASSHYPTHHRYLRNWLTQWSIEDFKVSRIWEILRRHPGRKFIVIFDNSNASLILAEKIHSEFSGKVVAVYLRQVIDKKIPSSATAFFTAFDIAVKEYSQERLSPEDVIKVGQAVLAEKRAHMLFPSYAVCPSDYNPCGHSSREIAVICDEVKVHVRSLCQKN